MVSVLSKKSQKEAAYISTVINTIVGSSLILVSALLLSTAEPLINLLGPGLTYEVHQIAVIQLQLMSPIAFIAGLIGISFGALMQKMNSFCLLFLLFYLVLL